MEIEKAAEPAMLTLATVNLQIDSVLPHVSSPQSAEVKKTALSRGQTLSRQLQGWQQTEQQPDLWTHQQLADRMLWMASFKLNKKGGIIFQDQDALKKQQGVVKDVVKQVGSQLLAGKLAVRISLPIRIFEPRTLLQRVADGWNYAPTLLKKAALSVDPLERMKHVIAFAVGGLHFCVGQLKPFNPILGETYQATYADGSQVFLEHVSHHPVRASFTLAGPKELYQLTGTYEFESVTSRNSIINRQIGTVKIVFHDDQVITYTMPQMKMSGILFGDRVVSLAGSMQVINPQNNLAADVAFDTSNGFLAKSQADDMKGQIRAIHPAASKHTLSFIRGSWLSHLQCDGKVYWHVESEPVFEHQPVEQALPSDSRFREDLIALKNGDEALAQSEKLRLEDLQRNDRKLRDTVEDRRRQQ